MCKPFFIQSRGIWAVYQGTQKVNLGPDRKAAFDKWHRMHAIENVRESPTVFALCELFMRWVRANQPLATYKWRKNYVQPFANMFGNRLVDSLIPIDIENWIQACKYDPGAARAAVAYAKRVINWSMDMGLVKSNPIARVAKPKGGRRTKLIDPTLQKQLVQTVHRAFRPFLIVMLHTGSRPGELARF